AIRRRAVSCRQYNCSATRDQMASGRECRMRSGLHSVCPDRRACCVPYQSQRPHVCLRRTDRGNGQIAGELYPRRRQPNRRDHRVPGGETGEPNSPLSFLRPRKLTMTLLDWTPINTLRKGSIPVLETERLVLRAPRFEDAKQVSALLNDRRVTENTARMP